MDEFEFWENQRNQDKRRRRKRFREDHRSSYTDEALGMAAEADSHDGNAANVEDWAAGLVDEEGRPNSSYRDWNEQEARADYPDTVHYQRPAYRSMPPTDPSQPSPALQRAAQFMDRANRRVRRRAREAPRYQEPDRYSRYNDRRDLASPTGSWLDSLLNFGSDINLNLGGFGRLSNIALIVLVVALIAACGCLLFLAAWIGNLFGLGVLWLL
jgi:hypothetical protein